MGILAFIRDNARWLSAGALMTGMSLFGQTLFISLYAGVWQEEFGLSHGDWGGIYTLGTIGSAALMIWAGGLTDRFRARDLGAVILVLLAIVSLGVAINPSAALLPIAIFGLRFCGQGMMFHIPLVAVGKWFAARRGRAISVVTLGFSVSEAILPIAFVLLTATFGWRVSWIAAAIVALLAIVPLRLLLRQERHPQSRAESEDMTGMAGRHWTRMDMLRHPLFWLVAPCVLAMPIFGTSLLFHQVHLTELKGWSLTIFVSFYSIYSLASVIAILCAGWAVDRWGSGRVAPLGAMALTVCFCVMSLGDSLGAAALGLLLLGVQQGGTSAAIGAFWPEYYGTRHLGKVRALASSLMVFGTALGPGITGWLIDLGVDFRDQLLGMAGIATISGLLFLVATERLGPTRFRLPAQ